jgi:bifunctional ADP-heptose synthase (sugar kinase/adenylyltransferase)
MTKSAIIANHAAGVVVGEVGTASVTQDQLLKSLNTESGLKIRESLFA